MIELKRLNIGYSDRDLTAPIDIQLVEGKVYALIGENGVGKSTLLRTISGLQKENNGTVLLKDKTVESYSNEQLSKLVSIVLTQKNSLGNFTVESVVEMGRTPYQGWWRKSSNEDHSVVKQSMEALGVLELASKSVLELSDGQFQKVMMAKALAQETPILLLDEPGNFLDLNAKIELFDNLKKWAKESNKLIVLSTHEIPLLKEKVDAFLMMTKEGIKELSVEELENDALFQKTFPKYKSINPQ